jgi:deoxyribodipyrimidine photo-lyase
MEVIPTFIFEDKQISQNEFGSKNAIEFMIDSLIDLDEKLKEYEGKLLILKGNTIEQLSRVIEDKNISAVYSNFDYTPFSNDRDKRIAQLCVEHKIGFHQFHDALLNPPGKIMTKEKNPYSVFTPFFKNASKLSVQQPKKIEQGVFVSDIDNTLDLKDIKSRIIPKPNISLAQKGGRKQALNILLELTKFSKYDIEKDYPAIQGTTRLSAHLKFGTLSVREIYYALEDQLGQMNPIIRQIYWRDFFTHILYFFPNVLGNSFRQKYDAIQWDLSDENFLKWCNGTTGFPIVDAGMRELNHTGYMHNRVRMIVASFLVKDLHIDWRKGEQYFATKLVDYDPALNNGNWQWCASTGCDAQPYFRIFNPWNQQLKFDPDCHYIKKWIPELKDLDAVIIHKFEKWPPKSPIEYPKPMVSHKFEAQKSILVFKNL